MYPIDLAPQKITIVKGMSNTEVKMAHLISGQPKTSGTGQLITHAGPVGLMRTAAQIITPGVSSQAQMIVSGPPILQGTQIVSQGSQLIGQTSQIISPSQLLNPSGQIISPGTQIISQGSQLSAQVSNSNNSVSNNNIQASVSSPVSGTQVLNVGGQLVSGSGSLVVSSSVRTLPPSVRVLPPLPHHNSRPVLSSINVSTASGVLVNKGVTSHVPRGLAAGASLAVRPVTPLAASQSSANQGGGAWSSSGRGRSALVYGSRGSLPRSTTPRTPTPTPASPTPAPVSTPTPQPSQSPHSAIITLPSSTVLTSSGVISNAVRGPAPRTTTPTPIPTAATPRPLPLLQRNYQPAKVVGVASVGVRGVVGNSAPSQLYYEVPRGTQHSLSQHQTQHQVQHQTQLQVQHQAQHLVPHQPQHQVQHQAQHQVQHQAQHQVQQQPQLQVQHQAPQLQAQHHAQIQPLPRPLTPYVHTQPSVQVTVVNASQTPAESRQLPTSVPNSTVLPRPSILRKREIDSSPSKLVSGVVSGGGGGGGGGVTYCGSGTPGWEDVPAGAPGPGSGSTTMSASSEPPQDEPEPQRPPQRPPPDLSPRKKPRKQMLSNEVRQCEFTAEDAPPTPPTPVNPMPKRATLGYVCGWRGTALHFVRPADVRRREPRARDILAIASQRHVLTSAEGWKVHHLTAQMDDLVSLEADVGEQLEGVLRALENASGRALTAIKPHSHTLLELIKGNIQRSKIVCEGIQEAREDILRVFKHRNFVSDILTRQADKRCFRKHRSQS
ncbi:unnamed protein product [Parnassius mnemosyne]|uniref:Histone deacetylase complex subunit SAP130 C-terminal domain-containing protein n=1 Tax=Parnassius mnemosyne TaxID=213953 RepID=A0AAV1LQ95_9NEOP